jgi:hypothetical protein
MFDRLPKLHYTIWFALLVLCSQWPYLLNHHAYWDGLIYTHFAETGEQAKFLTPWIENGRPVLGWMYWYLIESVGLTGGLQSIVVFSLWMSSVFSFLILRGATWLPAGFAWLAASILSVFPALHVHASFTTTFYVLLLPLFLLAILFRQLADHESGWKRYFILAISTLCLTTSFFSEGLIASSVAIPFLVRFLPQGRFQSVTWKEFAKSDIVFLLVPIGFLLLMPKLMPVSGLYSTSRNLTTSASEVFEFLGRYAETLLLTPLFSMPLYYLMVGAAFGGLVFAVIKADFSWRLRHSPKLRLFLLSTLFLFVASLPFVVSTRVPGIHGWYARHFTSLLFPTAIWISSCIYLCTLPEKVARVFSGMIVVGFGCSLVMLNLAWEARAAFDKGVIAKLAESDFKKAGIVYFEEPVESLLSETYRIYEWNPLLFQAAGDLRRILVTSTTPVLEPEADEGVRVQIEHSLVDDRWKEYRECAYFVSIRPTRSLDWRDGWRYLVARLAPNPKLGYWAAGLSKLSIRPGPGCPG